MKILVVDDDPIIRELLKEILTAFEFYDHTFAVCGNDAINFVKCTEVPFDCFLIDIQMPGMTGIELTKILRSSKEYERTPILMITAMSERIYVDAAFAAGATDYIGKPFELGGLHARLKLVSSLVEERKQKAQSGLERPTAPNTIMAPADLQSPLHVDDVDGAIDYLAMENYLLQMSRMALFGNCVFGVAIQDSHRLFSNVTAYEFQFVIADVMEAISDCLKPHRFMITHVGGGSFGCVRDAGRVFVPEVFVKAVHDRLDEMDLFYSNGKPITLRICVSEPIQLDLKSPKATVSALLHATARADEDAGGLEMAQSAPKFGLRALPGRS